MRCVSTMFLRNAYWFFIEDNQKVNPYEFVSIRVYFCYMVILKI